jgi:hypothetical protein
MDTGFSDSVELGAASSEDSEEQYCPPIIQVYRADDFVAKHDNQFENLAAKDVSEKKSCIKKLCCCC